MQQVMISVCHFSFGFLHSMVIADIFCPSVMCPKPLKIKKKSLIKLTEIKINK